MLVLSRRDRYTDESKSGVKVFDESGELLGTVRVDYAGRGTARLTFDFPADCKILREEVDGCRGKEAAA